MSPLVSVVIVSYNTRPVTLECLAALYAEIDLQATEVWVVDNASSDGSVEAIRTMFPQVRLIINERNAGFGAANNLALQQASGEFFLLLNSDAFLKPGALNTLVKYLQAHPEVAAVGPRLLNADGSLQVSCFRLPSPLRAWIENLGISSLLRHHAFFTDYRRWPHNRERFVEFVSGACLLVRRQAYEVVGGFDERFFLYAEETDWQHRMRASHWQIAFFPAAEVTHLGGTSGATDRPRINRHFFDSLDYYVWKHHGLSGLISLRLAMLVGCSARAIGWTAVMVAIPARRERARAKARLMSWLCMRQATLWRIGCLKRAANG